MRRRRRRSCTARRNPFSWSTAGVLAAVSAVCAQAKEGAVQTRAGEREPLLLAGRRSHLSLVHAAYLMRASVTWLWEEERTEGEAVIPGTVYPAEVMEALTAAADAGNLPAAVFVTSPTYYGVLGDVPSIVEIAHSFGVPVIVDEAHGAHLGFGQGMPDSAVHAGADLVIDSLHKTLPSLTQTALLHVQGKLVDRQLLRRFLRIYQTSSPSYVLMASIDSCLTRMKERPEELFGGAVMYKQIILAQSADWKHLMILSGKTVQDPCKVVVSTARTHMTGRELYDILMENYHIQPEMAGENEVVFILTGMDTEDGLEALLWSLAAVEGFLADGTFTGQGSKPAFPEIQQPEVVSRIADVWDAPSESVTLGNAAGRVCAELIVPYPPGTPLLVPGERIDDKMAGRLRALTAAGYRVRGVGKDSDSGDLVIPVMCGSGG